MPNDVVLQVHTNKIMPGASCGEGFFEGRVFNFCAPLAQAFKRNWVFGVSKPKTFLGLGDVELNYVSVINFCPYCGTNLQEKMPNYLQHHDGPPEILEGEKDAAKS